MKINRMTLFIVFLLISVGLFTLTVVRWIIEPHVNMWWVSFNLITNVYNIYTFLNIIKQQEILNKINSEYIHYFIDYK